MSELNKLAEEIYDINKENGFHDNDDKHHFAARVMLIVTELSEAVESDRKDDWSNSNNKVNKDKCFHDMKYFDREVKDSVEDEIADSIIRLLDLAHEKGIDIDFHVRAKMAYNSTRERLHGKKY